MTEVLNRLKADHRNLGHLLDLLERQLAVLEAGDGRPNYELLQVVLEYLLDYPDSGHHPREDVVYRLLQQRAPQAAQQVGDLLHEHGELAALTRRFARIIDGVLLDLEVPRDRLVAQGREFVRRYRSHMAREDAGFFPVAEARLLPEDWMVAASEFDAANDPLFGLKVEKRFAGLSGEIDAMAQESPS